MSRAKLLFIGLDAAEPELLEHWSADGTLPNLAKLYAGGRWGRATIPHGLSHAAAWASLYTGVNPGKHGWGYGTCRVPGSYAQRPFDPDRDLLRAPLWVLASQAGHRVAVVDIPKAPLTDHLNGVQISDWLVNGTNPPPRSGPPKLMDQTLRRFGKDPMGATSDDGFQGARGLERLRDVALERVRAKTALSLDLLAQGPWDLFMTTFGEPHDIGHRCWHLHDPQHPHHDAAWARRHGDPLRNLYVALDGAIAELLAAAGDARVVIFAGPGIQTLHTGHQLLDGILRRLELGPESPAGGVADHARRWAKAVLPTGIRRRLMRSGDVYARFAGRAARTCFPVSSNTDNGAIRVNLVGREPNGRIHPGKEFDQFCDQLREDLLGLRNPDTDGPVVRDLIRVDQAFHGPGLALFAPDLLVVWERERAIEAVASPKTGVLRNRFTGVRTGDHSTRTGLILHGQGIAPGALAGRPSVEDLGCTLAQMLGIQSAEADGHPLAF